MNVLISHFAHIASCFEYLYGKYFPLFHKSSFLVFSKLVIPFDVSSLISFSQNLSHFSPIKPFCSCVLSSDFISKKIIFSIFLQPYHFFLFLEDRCSCVLSSDFISKKIIFSIFLQPYHFFLFLEDRCFM